MIPNWRWLRIPLLWLLTIQPVLGFESFVISSIQVEGLQRISTGTLFNYLPVKVGETLTNQRAVEAIRALYRTTFFKDVRLEREGDTLIVSVSERPAVSKIEISGNKNIETETLLGALKDIGLAEGRVFDRSLLDKIEQELRRQYFAQGKYGVKITSEVTPLERNRVAVSIAISEGRVAKIKEISIVGNQVFENETLLGTFQLSPPTLFSFYTHNDQYSKQKLAADLETLRSYYLDRGYINFRIDSTQVTITPDKHDIYITINVTEGEQFTIREVKLAGNLVVPAEELFPLIESRVSDVFSRKATTETSSNLTDRLGAQGYAFANVNTIPEIDTEARQVTLTYFIDPGRRVYVRRVNVEGNTKTRDEVVRREVRQMESAWISTESVKRSRTRIDQTGYFEDTAVQTPAVPGTTDQVDVNFKVSEKASGNLLAGVGFSQSQGIIFNTSVTQDNFLGSGKRLGLSFNNSDINTSYSFSYTNPYYTLDGISRGFRVFYRETDAASANLADYNTDRAGASVTLGFPVNEFNRILGGLEYEYIRIKTTDSTPQEIFDFLDENDDVFHSVKLTASFSQDTRNRRVFADRGHFTRVSGEFTVPLGNLDYYKVEFEHSRYLPLHKYLTLAISTELGYGQGYGDTSQFPFFENFFAGGVRSVRGFEDNTLGPLDSNGEPIGGNLKLVGNVELLFPPPFEKDSKSVRFGAFLDFGNVFDDSVEIGDLRYSAGIAARWLSPLGALSFSLAYPLNDEEDDQVQVFQFTFGTNL